MRRLLASCVLACCAAARAGSAPATGILSAEELFRAAPLGEAVLSRDGRHLGTIVTGENDLKNLMIFDLKDFKPSGLRGDSEFEVATFHWLGDDGVVFSIAKDKVYAFGLYTAKIDRLESFTPIENFDATQIVGIPRTRPGSVLVWIVASAVESGRPGDLLELDANHIRSAFDKPRRGDTTLRAYKPPTGDPVVGWGVDQDGDLALCHTWALGLDHYYRYHRPSDSWSEIRLAPGSRPLGFDYDSRLLWVVTVSPKQEFELRQLNVETGAMADPVLTDPKYDIGGGWLHFSEKGRCLAGVTYFRSKPVTVWFSKDFAAVQSIVDQRNPGTCNILISNDIAERKFIFQLSGAQHPTSQVLLNLDAGTLSRLADAAPWLKDRPLRPTQSIGFVTRDGVKLEGYLTLPEGASMQHRVPLVVLAHGGPWVRDNAGYAPEVQFLASRGYAVLQPNYRGSTGFAPAVSREHMWNFMMMHDDVTDATKSMIATGLVDPKHIAIMGASFGGYLAVSGVAFDSGLYCCAVTECGVFDWERQIRSKSNVARPGEYERLVYELGRPGSGSEHLRDISPLEHADNIRVPVLIAHGTEDQIVDVTQSRKLASALRQRGVPCETFYRPTEGHGFFNYENRVEFYHRVEAFLAANLGGATLTPAK